MSDPLIILIGVCCVLALIFIFIYLKKDRDKKQDYNENKNNPNQTQNKKYQIKQKYISSCEKEFFNALKNIIGDKFIIYPQVPLSQIIEKQSNDKYHSELFRIIDFCIFNYEMKPLVCIEINDSSHNQYDRYKRDKKVQEILSAAGLPLITLWTSYGVNTEYIRKRLQDYINV